MKLELCPNCGTSVLFLSEVCPNCQRSRSDGLLDPTFTKPFEKPAAEPKDKAPARPPSGALATAFFLGAILAKFIGGELKEDAMHRAQKLPFFRSGQELNRAATIDVVSNILMVVLGVAGIVLLIRALRRQKTDVKEVRPNDVPPA